MSVAPEIAILAEASLLIPAQPARAEVPAASSRSIPHQRRTMNSVSDQKWTENQTSSG